MGSRASAQPTPVVIFGGAGTGRGRFDSARHTAIDGNDYVHVSDYGSLRVQTFDENGKYLGEWGIEAKGKSPTKSGAEALAADRVLLDAHGKVIDRIKKARRSIEGHIFASSRNRWEAPHVSPENFGIASDKWGTIYMVNRGAHDPAVYRLPPEGKYFIQYLVSNLHSPISTPSPPRTAAPSPPSRR